MTSRKRWFLLCLLVSVLAFMSLACDSGDDDDDDDDNDDNDDTGDDDDGPVATEGFSYIPAGTFQMGSAAGQSGQRTDETQHEVTLTRPFEMLKAEVTQGLFQEVMEFNPSHFPLRRTLPNRPVENVSWYDAAAFANKLSTKSGMKECYKFEDIVCVDETMGDRFLYCKDQGGIDTATVTLAETQSVYDCEGYRLPTESEWEYAARAGTTDAFYSGPINFPGCSPIDPNLDAIAWYCANADKSHHPVGEKLPNAWGLYDMLGNVMEWTWDNYSRTYPGDVTDPEGPAAETKFKSARGGGFRFYGANWCRSAFRTAYTLNYRSDYIGFRVVKSLPAEEGADDDDDTGDDDDNDDNDDDNDTGDDDAEAKSFEDNEGPYIGSATTEYPDSLPFEYTREDVGEPMTPEEISAFTAKITGFWKDVDYIKWLLYTSHGMSDTNPEGKFDYKLFWQDTAAIKEGDVVTFEHRGGADNLMIRTSKFFNNVAAGYLMTGDPDMARLVEQYSKGIVALFLGMMWGEEDPEDYIMARAIFTDPNEYEENGRQALVTYSEAKHERRDWNANTIPVLDNPYWDDVWARTMRSKDDVPHIFRMVPMMKFVVRDAPDENVREATAMALEYMEGFARDMIDSGYSIRTKDDWGNSHIPFKDGLVNDLASFDLYNVVDPLAECPPKIAAAFIAYGEPFDTYCGNGIGPLYEQVATDQHYFNWAIIRYFHIAALSNALMAGNNEIAYMLMQGLEQRAIDIMADEESRELHYEWDADFAAVLLASATYGLPLTSEEARFVVEYYSISADHYGDWPNWDLWDDSVPEGEIDMKPRTRTGPYGTAVRHPALLYPIEYCYSPFKNETSAPWIDCDIVSDPSRWGEE